ncbi:MAG: LysM peptidoglycan-binding domain-containing protein [Campylobacteraceae bacterium]|nr:LysM peptidoglycan-binding domain-containing protein [Campylobacteraceae bacterium]
MAIPAVIAAIGKEVLQKAATAVATKLLTDVGNSAIEWVKDKFSDSKDKSNVAGKAIEDTFGKQSQNVTTNNGQMQQGNIIINNYFQSGNDRDRAVIIHIDDIGSFEGAKKYQEAVANGKGTPITAQNIPSNVISVSCQNKTAQICSNDPDKMAQMCNDVASNVQGIDKLDMGGKIYNIIKGDSLYKIAKENNITLDELRKANPWVEDRFSQDQKFALIHPNEKLIIPNKENVKTSEQQSINAKPAAPTTTEPPAKEIAIGDVAKGIAKTVGTAVKDMAVDAMEAVKSGAKEIGQKVANAANDAFDWVKNKAEDVKVGIVKGADAIVAGAKSVGNAIVGIAESINNVLTNTNQKVIDAANETADFAREKIGEMETKVLSNANDLKNEAQNIKKAVSDKIETARSEVKEFGKSVTNTLIETKAAIEKEFDKAETKISDITKEIKKDMQETKKAVSEKFETLKSDVKEFGQKLTDTLKEAATEIQKEFDKAETKISDTVKEIRTDMREAKKAVSDKFDEVKDKLEKDVKSSSNQSIEELAGKVIGREITDKDKLESKAELSEASKNTHDASQNSVKNESDNVSTASM